VIKHGRGRGARQREGVDFAVAISRRSRPKAAITRAKQSIATSSYARRADRRKGDAARCQDVTSFSTVSSTSHCARARLQGRAARELRRPRQYASPSGAADFPEIVYDKTDKVRGIWTVNIVTTARTDEDAQALLTHLGMAVQGVVRAMAKTSLLAKSQRPRSSAARLHALQLCGPSARVPAASSNCAVSASGARAQGRGPRIVKASCRP